jgi:hypothetical protein
LKKLSVYARCVHAFTEPRAGMVGTVLPAVVALFIVVDVFDIEDDFFLSWLLGTASSKSIARLRALLIVV